ncbi:DELLA protein RGL1-like [Camellia sinensis]|uniref:Uncharacterized protein n=1 Tax=Camellia sinensis var. sinensis TaxID=542762 RepID=A0A4S4EIW5_CAMSN|nr:DELLA protein RGL1-like [Camellia sinensis]THG16481.1 hypothetical protein TEA_001662 [Camellia sinensis var. sinensis]
MTNAMFSFSSFNIDEIQGGYNSLREYEKDQALSKDNQNPLSGLENWGDIGSLCSKYGFYQEIVAADKSVYFPKVEPPPPLPPLPPHQSPPPISNYGILGDFQFNPAFPLTEPIPETKTVFETKKEEQYCFSSASLELLSNYAGGLKKLKGEKYCSNLGDDETKGGGQKLSTEEIMRVAGERYIQFSTQRVDEIFMLAHPYGSSFSGLCLEETRDVELAHLLLAAAEKVGYQQYERASRLLKQCDWLASDTGNPVQRVVYYFVEALRERIDRETGRFVSRSTVGEQEKEVMASLGVSSNLVSMKIHQEIPFTQVMLFAGIQAVLENVALEINIHLVDFHIKSGVQWIVLMQALAERATYPIQHLKLTAVGTTEGHKMEETCKRLATFAESLSLSFSFKVVLLLDMKDIKKEHFDVEAKEAVVIYSNTILRDMISRPNCLETLMRVIRSLNPSIMVVIEVEANHNSPSFFNRFIETLFFFSAFFDCLEDCMERENKYRMIVEGIYFRNGIHNIVATEGEERVTRSVKMNVWRAFFARFGMVGLEMSESSLYQANLIVNRFSCGSSCTLENDGECLTVGWKGTPIHSLTTWKFR